MKSNTYTRRGRIYPFLFIFILLWLGAGSLSATAEWTVLVYMAADNGLSEYAIQDINDMESAAIPTNTNVIVQADFSDITNPSGAYRYKIKPGVSNLIESQVLASLGEIDSGDWNNLKSFINWGFARYPATHKALIIWSHGDSWYKADNPKWICQDGTARMYIADGDLRKALSNSPLLDILLFDACSMQSIEVLNEVYDKAKLVIGSEDIVPATGFPYQDILPIWQGEPESLAVAIPEIYINSYAPYGSQNPYGYQVRATCSTLATSYLNAVNSHLLQFVMNSLSEADTIFAARQLCYNLNTFDAEIDLKEFLSKAAVYLPSDNRIEYIQPLLNALDALVLTKSAMNYTTDIGYLTIWFPYEPNAFNNWWQQYTKLRMTETWLGLVSAALGTDIGIPHMPVIDRAILLFDDLKVTLSDAPNPELIRINMRYSHDDTQFDDKELITSWRFYSPKSNPLTATIKDIQGSGWLFIEAQDFDGNISPKDSVYVNWKSPKPSLYIYPNPCTNSGAVYFHWWTSDDKNEENQTETTIRIYNIKGRLVHKFKSDLPKQGSEIVTFKHLPSGIYFAKLRMGKKELITKFTLLSNG